MTKVPANEKAPSGRSPLSHTYHISEKNNSGHGLRIGPQQCRFAICDIAYRISHIAGVKEIGPQSSQGCDAIYHNRRFRLQFVIITIAYRTSTPPIYMLSRDSSDAI